MFDLEREILAWRRQMIADGLNGSERLDELEDHLRNDIDDQLRSGVDLRAAFEAAVGRIGQASVIRGEFEKVRRTRQRRCEGSAFGAKVATCMIVALSLVWTATAYAFGFQIAQKTVVALFSILVLAVPGLLVWRYVRRSLVTSTAIPIDVTTWSATAQQSLELAREEAKHFGHDYVGTEHLLLAILRLNAGVIQNVLGKVGVAREALRAAIEERITANTAHGVGPSLPYTPRLNDALRVAVSEAAYNPKQMDAGHLLLGLLRERDGIAGRVLRSLGFGVEQVRSCLTAL